MTTYREGNIRIEVPEMGQFYPHVAELDLVEGNLFGVDCETNGAHPWSDSFKLRTVQIATTDLAYVFRTDDPDQRAYVRDFLNNDVNSFASHTDADVMFLWRGLGVDISHRNVDTRTLGTLASPSDKQGGLDLKSLAKKYLKVNWLEAAQGALQSEMVELYKRDHPTVSRPPAKEVSAYGWANIPVDHPIYVKYGGLDAVAALLLVPVLIKFSSAPFSLIKMETWLDAQASQMKMRGMQINREAYDKLYTEKKAACDYHEGEFGELVFEHVRRGRKPNYVWTEKPISPRSGKKVAKYLHDMGADFTGFPLTDKGQELLKDGLLTTEDEVYGTYASMGKDNKHLLKTLNVAPEAEVAIEHLFGFKESIYTVTKLEEIAKVIDSTDTVHPTLRACGTVTGRSSSSGPNTQNYSKKDPEMREVFVPRPGYVLIGCDFEQVEIKIAAALSQCPVLLDLLLTGVSMHQMTMDALGVDKPIAKIFNFASLYGAGPKALAKQTGQKYDECRYKLDLFWETYTGLNDFRQKVSRETPDIRTVAHRKIPVPYDWDKHQYRGYVSLNYHIQSAAREMAMAAWWRFVNTPGTEDMNVWAFVHDEFVVEVAESELEFGLAALQSAMNFEFRGVKITAEAVVMADPQGNSFWTTGEAAEKYSKQRASEDVPLV